MPSPVPFIRKYRHFILTAFCTLLIFCILFIFRRYDDNRLVSWEWTFAYVNLLFFVPVMIAGTIIVYALFRSSFLMQSPLLFLMVFSFAVSSVVWQVPEVIVDTSRYFTQAKHLEVYGIRYFFQEWGRAVNAWTDLPFVPFLYGMIFKIFGEARIFIQVFLSLLFSLTVGITYLTGRALWDRETGMYAAFMLPGIPYIFSQTPLMLVDVPTMFFLTLSVYTFIRAMENGGKWIVFTSLAVFSAILSKYSSWMMLSVLGVVLCVCLIQRTEERKQVFYRGCLVFLFAGLLAGIIFFLKYDVMTAQIQFLREYQMPGLKRWGESFVSTFFYQVHPFITIAALYSVYAALKSRDVRFLIISWLMFLVVVMQIRRSRYVLITFPMLTLMASYGLQKIKDPELKKYIVSCAVASSLAVAIFAYSPFLQSMSMVNFKNAGRALNSSDIDHVFIFTVPSSDSIVNPSVAVPIIDLFTDKRILYYDDEFSPPYEEIRESPLRFTWEYKNPDYYAVRDEATTMKSAIAVISNTPLNMLPVHIEKKIKGYKREETFKTSTGIFRYSPVVTLYLPDGS